MSLKKSLTLNTILRSRAFDNLEKVEAKCFVKTTLYKHFFENFILISPFWCELGVLLLQNT